MVRSSSAALAALAFVLVSPPTDGAAQSPGTRFLRQPSVSADAIAFVHANDIWVVGRDGGQARRLTTDEGAETDPAFSPDGRWIAFTGRVRRQPGRVRGRRDGRAARAAHVAPRRRRGPGVDAGRPHRLPVGPGGRADPVVEVLHDPARGRSARAAARPPGLRGRDERRRLHARLPGDRLLGPGVAELPWRTGAARPRRRSVHPRAEDAPLGGRAADGPHLDGRRRLLHVRARLGEQRVVVRPTHGRGEAAHAPRGLRREEPGRGPRRGRVRAGGLSARAGSGERPDAPAGDPGGGRPELGARPVGGRAGRAAHEPAPVSHRQAGALRVPGRDLHRPGGVGLVAEPHRIVGRGGPLPHVVARRRADRLVQRRGRRVRAGDRGPGGTESAPHHHPRQHVLLPPDVVPRRHEDRLHGHGFPRAHRGRGVRPRDRRGR